VYESEKQQWCILTEVWWRSFCDCSKDNEHVGNQSTAGLHPPAKQTKQ